MLSEPIHSYILWKSVSTSKAATIYPLYLERFNKSIQKPLEKIEEDDVNRYRYALQKKFSPTTVAYITTILKDFFGYWRRKEGERVQVNPDNIRVPKYTPKSHLAVTEEDFKKLEAAFSEDTTVTPQKQIPEIAMKLFIRLLYETGVRVSELTSLRKNDLDLVNMRALINSKKSFSQRWIFWSTTTNELIKKCPCEEIRVTDKTVQRWVSRACERAKITTHYTPHSFRHGKAHHIMNSGGDIMDVVKLLGHSEINPKTAFNYLKLHPVEIEKRARLYLRP